MSPITVPTVPKTCSQTPIASSAKVGVKITYFDFHLCSLQCYRLRQYICSFLVVKNCFSKAVLFCVPAQVTTHTHYLLMPLTCTCLAWHGPYHLCFQFLLSAVHPQVRQDWTRGRNWKYCRVWKMLYTPKWFVCSLQLLQFLVFNGVLYQNLFWQYHPFFPYGENLSISPAERWAEI